MNCFLNLPNFQTCLRICVLDSIRPVNNSTFHVLNPWESISITDFLVGLCLLWKHKYKHSSFDTQYLVRGLRITLERHIIFLHFSLFTYEKQPVCIISNTWSCHFDCISSVRQKGESQNGCFKKTKQAIFREIWCSSFSWNIRFEIHPFVLLLTI